MSGFQQSPSPPDVDALLRRIQELESRLSLEAIHQTALETFTDGFLAIDRDSRILDVNAAAERLLGRTRDQMIGRLPLLAFPEFLESGLSSGLQVALRADSRREFELYVAPWDRWFLIQTNPLEGGNRALFFRDITHQKAAQAKAQQSPTQLGLIMNALPALIAYLTPDFRYLMANATYGDWLGIDSSQIVGRTVQEVVGDERFQAIRPSLERAQSGHLTRFEHWMTLAGMRRYLASNYVPDFGEDGQVRGIVAMVEDLTALKIADQQARELSHQLEAHLANTPMAVIEYTPDFRISRWSSFAEKLLGWKSEEMLGQRYAIAPWVYEDEEEAFEAIASDEQRQSGRWVSRGRNYTRDGRVLDMEWYNSTIRDENGNVRSVLCFGLDISARTKAERALRRSEAKLRRVIEVNAFGTAIRAEDGRVLYANDAYLHMVGYTQEELQAGLIDWIQLTAPEFRARDQQALQELKEKGVAVPYEKVYVRRDGIRVPILVSSAMLEPFSQSSDLLSFYVDLTGLKAAEHQLRETSERLELATRAGGVGVFDWDMVHDINIWSHELQRIYGIEPGTFQGDIEGWAKLVFPEDAQRIGAQIIEANALQIPEIGYEFRILRPGGEVRWLKGRGHFTYDDQGRAIRMIGTNIDITESKAAQEALQASNEALMRANLDLEQFAYTASHDLQEPLRMVSLYTQMIARRYEASLDEDARQYLRFVVEGVSRMESLIRDLLAYTRVTTDARSVVEPVDGNVVLSEVLADLNGSVAETGAEIQVCHLPHFRMERVHLKQLLQNLVSNAIRYRNPEVKPVIRIESQSTGERCLMSVIDNGVGIDPRYHEQIFGIFKRLQSQGNTGTGIGLAICQKIVERYRGKIWVESQLGSGAAFRFTLPGE
jgi:PAS domain S-box-containing protein